MVRVLLPVMQVISKKVEEITVQGTSSMDIWMSAPFKLVPVIVIS